MRRRTTSPGAPHSRHDDFSWQVTHTMDSPCNRPWCRLHWYTRWDPDAHAMDHLRYPGSFNYQTSPGVWHRAWVYCGPSAFYPKRPSDAQWQTIRMSCVHVQADLTCDTCLRHTFRPLEI